MAVVMRKRRIANPGRKRRRLSLKQLLHFGSKRQRAAAALRLKRRRPSAKRRRNAGMFSWRKTKKRYRVHGHTAARIKRHYRARRKNAGILSFTLNPGRKLSRKRRKVSMARRRRRVRRVVAHRRRRHNVYRRRRRNLFGIGRKRRSYRRRRHNPGRRVIGRRRVRHYGRRRRGNPSLGGIGLNLKSAAWVIAGGVGTRMLTQAIFGAVGKSSANTGMVGYIANGIVATLLGPLSRRFVGAPAAKAITLGGFVGIAFRLLQDFTPWGKQLSFSGMGDVGIYLPTTFFSPLSAASNADGNVMTMPAAVQALAAPRTKAMAGLSGSRYGAGASRYA